MVAVTTDALERSHPSEREQRSCFFFLSTFLTSRSEKSVLFLTSRSEKSVLLLTSRSEKPILLLTPRSDKPILFLTSRSKKPILFFSSDLSEPLGERARLRRDVRHEPPPQPAAQQASLRVVGELAFFLLAVLLAVLAVLAVLAPQRPRRRRRRRRADGGAGAARGDVFVVVGRGGGGGEQRLGVDRAFLAK